MSRALSSRSPYPRTDLDSVILHVGKAIVFTIEGKLDRGRTELEKLKGPLSYSPRWRKGRERKGVAPTSTPPAGNSNRRNMPVALQHEVFCRDGWICRYCDRPTILLPVLHVLSSFYPSTIKYRPGWQGAHWLYWYYSATGDHLNGLVNSARNLVTACYRCQQTKPLGSLPSQTGRRLEAQVGDWDGFRGYSRHLLETWLSTRPDEALVVSHLDWPGQLGCGHLAATVKATKPLSHTGEIHRWTQVELGPIASVPARYDDVACELEQAMSDGSISENWIFGADSDPKGGLVSCLADVAEVAERGKYWRIRVKGLKETWRMKSGTRLVQAIRIAEEARPHSKPSRP